MDLTGQIKSVLQALISYSLRNDTVRLIQYGTQRDPTLRRLIQMLPGIQREGQGNYFNRKLVRVPQEGTFLLNLV
jgi:hypothetical protein